MNKLSQYKKSLRKEQTKAEAILWSCLRNRKMNNYKFRRQHVLQHYIVDFICLKKNLIVELDGGQHANQQLYDADRTTKLEKDGYRILRFWNFEILTDTKRVLEVILDALRMPYSSGK